MLAPTISCPSDIVFAVDNGGSITSTNFATVKSFLSQVVSRLDIGRGNARVGLLTYSTYIRTHFHLNTYFTVALIQSAISRLGYSRGTSNMAAALSQIRRYMLTSARGDRYDAPNVIVVLTHGRSSNSSATQVGTMLSFSC